MDYELITSRINVRLVLTKVRPVYHFYLLYKKFISHYLLFLSMSLYHPKLVTWSYARLLIASPYSLSHCPLLLFYTCMTFTLYLHVPIILTMFLYLPNQLTIILRWSELIYYYSDTVKIIVYYVWVCVILGECIEVCHGGYKGEYEHVYVWRGGGTSITKSMYITILRVTCDYENMLLCFSSFFTYVQILIALVFAISTHLLVHTECPVFMSMGYIPVMCAYVCDPYDIVIHIIIILSHFSNYTDHSSDIEPWKLFISIGNIQFQHTLSMLNISQLNYSLLQKNNFRDNHILEGDNKINKVSIYSWPTNIITHFMICYIILRYICSNKKILMEMYNYKTTHFMYEVWYMYEYSCSEGREGSVPPSQCLTIRVLPYLFSICIYYVCSHYYTHTNGYRTHTIISIKNIVGCKINCVQVKYLIRQSKITNHNRTNVVSHIVRTFLISLAITVCMCSSMLIVYSHVPLLERYALQRYYVIHFVFMYNACILVLSHYTAKGKHQGGGNLFFHMHPWVYSKYTDYG